ncbi:MAG: class I SAM-dependent methyltransferase [Candidatus Heimdallarchaeota archaeon]|nr:MAG: class I SAM-dependent methyltransferase [Candidatus Heimdallarchaeota archaeon]
MDFKRGVTDIHQPIFDLHDLEEKLMISPFKKLMLSCLELTVFKYFLRSVNAELTGKSLLEVGCGAGYGIVQIHSGFKPREYVAFDISKKMVSYAAAKVKKQKIPVHLFVGDVRDLKLPSNRFDAAFAFTVLHHVEGWKDALKEINRVLKPHGLLMINEINDRSLNWFERYLKVYHPKKARFNWVMFRRGLLNAKFQIIREFHFLKDLGFFLCVKK